MHFCSKMPKYFCDYCDTHLTHDSPSVRKTHNSGRKHKENVRMYYQQWMEEQAQKLVDATAKAFKEGKIPANPIVGMMRPPMIPPGAMVPGSVPGMPVSIPPQGMNLPGMTPGVPYMVPPPNPMSNMPQNVVRPPMQGVVPPHGAPMPVGSGHPGPIPRPMQITPQPVPPRPPQLAGMSILEKILNDLYVDPLLLAELDESQKQLLFCKMREEQVRRWMLREKELEKTEPATVPKRSETRVKWILDEKGEPCVWVLGEDQERSSSPVESIPDDMTDRELYSAKNNELNGETFKQENGLEKQLANNENGNASLDELDFNFDARTEEMNIANGMQKIPVSEDVLRDVEEQIRSMARKAREQHWLQTLSVDSRVQALPKTYDEKPANVSARMDPSQLSRSAILQWYRTEEFPRAAGVEMDRRTFAFWFHGILNRSDAERLLHAKQVGAYLVRISEKICGYVLSYQAGFKVKHFMVLSFKEGYHFVGSKQIVHSSLNSLIEYHQKIPISENGQEILREAIGPSPSPEYVELLDLFRL
ncbi:U1 small nuclear ribonucleoprotein C [Trichinella pseudospiralis]|uniref:U1 small nuclear ribonucleoprotein C n=1 Tax=Trichinella pseudospiralis TaxID=6337 RepID=A0A0V1J4B1_TRIPS|nr:U1 small nuclear ribonucleoprotein C [Trichinella pseudospiralis]